MIAALAVAAVGLAALLGGLLAYVVPRTMSALRELRSESAELAVALVRLEAAEADREEFAGALEDARARTEARVQGLLEQIDRLETECHVEATPESVAAGLRSLRDDFARLLPDAD